MSALKKDVAQRRGQQDNLTQEMQELAEQKEYLLKIVEDLHQTCVGAGLGAELQASRHSIASMNSITSITANFKRFA